MKILLIVIYTSWQGVVSVDEYPMQTYSECKEYARQIFANVKAGRVKTKCEKR